MASPTALTLHALRASGYTADVVERFVAAANIRRDWGGFGDVLAAGRGEIVLVQCTTADHVAHRLAKARGRPELRAWLAAGGKFQVWGWHRRSGNVGSSAASRSSPATWADEVDPARRRTRRPKQRSLFDGE